MTSSSLISAIMPAYNHERFVAEALRSLIAQTYQHVELIVLDDGSTDATYREIKELEPELKRRFVRVEIGTKGNEGSVRTISRCLALARSDLVYMLDSDDLADPYAIERLLPFMAAPDVALAVGDNEYIDDAGQPLALSAAGEYHPTLLARCTKPRAGFSVDRDFGTYASLIEGNYVPNGWLFRRRCVDDVGGYPSGITLDDWSLLLQLAKKYRLRFEGSILAKYRVHENNTISIRNEDVLLDCARILLQERAYCRHHGVESQWSRHARSIFTCLTAEQIGRIVDNPLAMEDWWEERSARIEDLARIGKLEADALVAAEELRLADAAHQIERDRLHSEHERTTRSLLAAAENSHQAERDRLLSEHERVTRAILATADAALQRERERLQSEHEAERDHLKGVVSATQARLEAIESSRSWRWTGPIRSGLKALAGPRFQRWEVALDPVTADSTSLGGLQLTGWAFHRDAPVTRIEISAQGQMPFVVECGIERPDVALAFPNCDVGRPGFRTLAHVPEDPITLFIKLVLGDGRTQVVQRTLHRPQTLNDEARGVFGAPDRLGASWLGLAGDLVRYGGVGRYVWESRRIRGWVRGSGEAEGLVRASQALAESPVIVEVGTFLGCSTVLLAGPCKRRGSGRVHCIDTFSQNGDDEALPIYRAIASSLGMSMRQAFENNIRKAGLSDWVTVHEMSAAEAAGQWKDPIDLLFLDGDVSVTGSREIFQAWSPFLRSGGILAVNGTVERPSRTGSYQIVQEFVRPPAYEDIRRVDHITFARKCKGR